VRVGLESGGPQRAALFNSTGAAVVLASEASRQIKLWDSAKTFGRSVFSFPESCHAVADAQQLAIGSDDGVAVIRRLPGGEPIAKLRGHRASIDEAVPSPSGGLLATHSLDGEVLLWDLKGFQLLRRLTLDPSSEGAEVRLVFSPDEQTLAAAANTGGVRLWTLPSGDVLRDLEFSIEDVARIAFAPDSTAFATAVAERGGTIWNIRGDAQLGAFGHERVVWDLCYSPDGARLYGAAGLNGVVGWNARSGRELFRLAGHRGHVDLVAVSPDGQTLATSATDNAVRLWHIPTGRPLFTLTNNSGHAEWLRFASPRKLLVGARPEPDAPIAVYVFSAEDSATP
jgi:WD40 repeat protein